MRLSRRTFLEAASAGSACGLASGGVAWSQEPARPATGEGDSSKVLATMRRLAGSVRIRDLEGPPPGRLLTLREEPVLRYSDPPRGILDATLWAWEGRAGGRPMAALKVEHYPTRPPERRWLQGLVSLAPGRIEATFHDGQTWASSAPGFVARPVPGAPAPAASAVRRLAESRDLVRRFAAIEHAPGSRGRLTLRLMPRPLLRYSEPDAGLADGILFAYAFGTNPDVLLVMEAHDRPDPQAWRYGVGRLGGAEGVVELDGKGVWSVPSADPPRQLETYMNRRVAEDDAPR